MAEEKNNKQAEELCETRITDSTRMVDRFSNMLVEYLLKTKAYPKESIKLLKNLGKKPSIISKAILCKTLWILQNKDLQVFNLLLPEVKNLYPDLEQEGSQNGWEPTYQRYLQEEINRQFKQMNDWFNELLEMMENIIVE